MPRTESCSRNPAQLLGLNTACIARVPRNGTRARDLGAKGAHIAYFNIDAVIDVPWTRGRFHPDKPDEFFIKPADIAEEVFHVAHQPRSAWSSM